MGEKKKKKKNDKLAKQNQCNCLLLVVFESIVTNSPIISFVRTATTATMATVPPTTSTSMSPASHRTTRRHDAIRTRHHNTVRLDTVRHLETAHHAVAHQMLQYRILTRTAEDHIPTAHRIVAHQLIVADHQMAGHRTTDHTVANAIAHMMADSVSENVAIIDVVVVVVIIAVMVVVVVATAVVSTVAQTVADHHAGRMIEPLLQIVADQPECRQSHPARFHRARAGHAVAFALLVHLLLDVLLR